MLFNLFCHFYAYYISYLMNTYSLMDWGYPRFRHFSITHLFLISLLLFHYSKNIIMLIYCKYNFHIIAQKEILNCLYLLYINQSILDTESCSTHHSRSYWTYNPSSCLLFSDILLTTYLFHSSFLTAFWVILNSQHSSPKNDFKSLL